MCGKIQPPFHEITKLFQPRKKLPGTSFRILSQNRIVRLEMRLRCFELTGKRLEPVEAQLGFGRIAALRFASDRELPELLRKALSENLSAKAIKQSVKDWVPDHMRV